MADIYNLIPNEGFKYSLQVNDLNLFPYLEIGLEMIIAQNSKYLELCFMVIARDATGNPGNPFPEVPGRFSPTRSPGNIIRLPFPAPVPTTIPRGPRKATFLTFF